MPSSKSPPPPRPPSAAGSARSFFEAEAADDEDERPPPEVDSVAVGLVLSGSAAACRCAGAAVVVLEVISRPSRQSLPSVKTSHSLSWTPPLPPPRRQTSLSNSKSAHPLHGPKDRRVPRKRVSALPPHGRGELPNCSRGSKAAVVRAFFVFLGRGRRGWSSYAQESTCPRYGSTLGIAQVAFPTCTRPSRAPLFFKFTTLEYLVVGARFVQIVSTTRTSHRTYITQSRSGGSEGIVQLGPSRVEHQIPYQSRCKKGVRSASSQRAT